MNTLSRLSDWTRAFLKRDPVAGVLLRPNGWHQGRRLFLLQLTTSLAISLFLALAQSSSAINLSFSVGWLFWELHVLFGFSLILAGEWLLLETSLVRTLRIALLVALLPVFLAPLSILLDELFAAVDLDSTPSAGSLGSYLSEIADITPLSIFLSVTALYTITQTLREGPSLEEESEYEGAAIPNRIDDILETEQSSLIRISAQDHYCEVVTSSGRQLVSEKFTACLQAVEHRQGIQTHRSHWVALEQIEQLRSTGSSYELVLSNEERVPVSRRRYAAVKHILKAL